MNDIEDIQVPMTVDDVRSIVFEDQELRAMLEAWGRISDIPQSAELLEKSISQQILDRIFLWKMVKVNDHILEQEKIEKAEARKLAAAKRRKEKAEAKKKEDAEYLKKSKINPLNFTGRKEIPIPKHI